MEAQVTDTPSSDAQAQALGAPPPPGGMPPPGGITMKQLLEAGVHFGHQTRRWNPKMKPYIFGARNGIYIIDLQKTVTLARAAFRFVADVTARGASVLFVGTKKQAQDVIREEALRCGQYHVTSRWLGGTLTNFRTIKQGIDRLKTLEKMSEDGTFDRLPKKEVASLQREHDKLEKNLGGVKDMSKLPGCVFVVDPKKEHIAVHEASRLGIPVIAVVDTNCDPEGIDYVIPGNDDAIRSIKLFTGKVADAALEGMARYKASGASERDEQDGREERPREDRRFANARRSDRRVGAPAGERRGPLVEIKGQPTSGTLDPVPEEGAEAAPAEAAAEPKVEQA